MNDPLGQTHFQMPIKAASPGLFRAVHAELESGRFFDAGHADRGERVVETRIGATALVASQIPLALSPNDPLRVKVAAPPEPKLVKDGVQSDLNSLFLILGGVSLLVGAIGIANVTLVSVLERTGEIGLRRALGAGRRHIAAQFLAESTAMGLIGGVLGASAGLLVVVGIALTRKWTAVIDPLTPLIAPLLGAGVGLLADLYPSLRAARLEPVDALRSGT